MFRHIHEYAFEHEDTHRDDAGAAKAPPGVGQFPRSHQTAPTASRQVHNVRRSHASLMSHFGIKQDYNIYKKTSYSPTCRHRYTQQHFILDSGPYNQCLKSTALKI